MRMRPAALCMCVWTVDCAVVAGKASGFGICAWGGEDAAARTAIGLTGVGAPERPDLAPRRPWMRTKAPAGMGTRAAAGMAMQGGGVGRGCVGETGLRTIGVFFFRNS